MKIPKDNAMLIDIQYQKPDKINGKPDYLYIIWKECDSGKKHLQIIPEPKMDIYFEKDEYRNHHYNRNYQLLERCNKKTVKYSNIIYEIANDQGESGKRFLNNCFDTRDYKRLNEVYAYPYVFGADYDIRTWYRYKWMQEFSNDKPKNLTIGFMDIEVDSLEAPGFADATYCPIDLVTLIDTSTKKSYTFALIGVDYKEPHNINVLSPEEREKEEEKKRLYAHRMKEQKYYSEHPDEVKKAAHDMFDENYPGMEYNFFFYTDERKLIVHLFQLINTLKLDFLEIWNIAFDIPYIIDRCNNLGLNPTEVICSPDFPTKECYFKQDMIHHDIKNKSDFFRVSSYTIFTDDMRNYAAIRKGMSELRSNKLTYIAQKEIGDEKLDYSESGNIKTVSYNNYLLYILYNIKDVLLQCGIEERTNDTKNYYMTSYENLTPYEDEFKQTKILRNVQYEFFMSQGMIPGENVNSIFFREEQDEKEEEEKDDSNSDEPTFEGALVGDPVLIQHFGEKIFGKKSDSVFQYSVDFDMSSFYPSTIDAMNIDPSTLIFKMSMNANQYNVRGGDLPYKGITDVQLNNHNSDSFKDDISKEFIDNIQTDDILYTGYKWLNLPSVNDMYDEIKKKLGD